MIDNINYNPYRILGLWSNSPAREKQAHLSQLRAFLKVGRPVSFPQDLPQLLPVPTRTQEQVDAAESQLSLPQDQLHHAQFWLMKSTQMDEIAFNHLAAGNIDTALSIWEKRDTASSLQNRIVFALIRDDYATAISCAEKLYTTYLDDFVTVVLGPNHVATTDALDTYFLDTLCDAIGAQRIASYIHTRAWADFVAEKTVEPLIGALQDAVDTARATRGMGIMKRYNAGVQLMNETKTDLTKLRQILSASDLRYQKIADAVGLEILQCGIDYFNGSEAANAPYKAMTLQKYALSIVVGVMAKARCKENVDILQNIISQLPPQEVVREAQLVQEELRKCNDLPNKLCYAQDLINHTRQYLSSIKQQLGQTHPFYLKLSTQVVNLALYNIIEEVNAVQMEAERQMSISPFQAINKIRPVVEKAWDMLLTLDSFDMESEFKAKRYAPNRQTLKELRDQIAKAPTIPSYPHTLIDAPTPQPTYRPSTPTPHSDDGWGCGIWIWIILGAIFLGCILFA